MFLSTNIPSVFKKGTLKLVPSEDGGSKRVAEATLIVEPFPVSLARELGEEIAGHLFTDDGAIRDELESVDLRVRAGLQRITVRPHEDLHPVAVLEPVSIKDVSVKRIDDKASGRSWLSLTFALVFSLENKAARNFVLDEFGKALLWSFDGLQRDLLNKASLHESIAKMVPDGTTVSLSVSGGEAVEIDAEAHRREAKRLRNEAKTH